MTRLKCVLPIQWIFSQGSLIYLVNGALAASVEFKRAINKSLWDSLRITVSQQDLISMCVRCCCTQERHIMIDPSRTACQQKAFFYALISRKQESIGLLSYVIKCTLEREKIDMPPAIIPVSLSLTKSDELDDCTDYN